MIKPGSLLMGIDYRTTIRRMTPTDMPSMAFQDLLSDVIIEVHPTRTLDNINDDVATAPIAQIPAHAAILASQSKYFHAMFSSGMEEAVTLESRKEKTRIRFFGYSVKAIKFFLVHMYQEENARKVANSQNVLNDAKELLALANQYECTSLFDRVSYSILEVSLNHQTVVQCLALAYEYPDDINFILRTGSWEYYKQNKIAIQQQPSFRKSLREDANEKIMLPLLLEFLDKIHPRPSPEKAEESATEHRTPAYSQVFRRGPINLSALSNY